MLHFCMIPTGQAIYLWRRDKGLTQAQLAQASGLPRPNLSMIEQGGRDLTLGTLRRIAKVLEVNPGVLVDGIPPKSHERKVWTRENLDRIARFLTGEKTSKLSEDEKTAVETLKPLVLQKIQLFRGQKIDSSTFLRKGARHEAQSWLKTRSLFSSSEMDSLLGRIDKILQTQ